MTTPSTEQVATAIKLIRAAMQRNEELQVRHAICSPDWHACETIDDRLHEALAELGD